MKRNERNTTAADVKDVSIGISLHQWSFFITVRCSLEIRIDDDDGQSSYAKRARQIVHDYLKNFGRRLRNHTATF